MEHLKLISIILRHVLGFLFSRSYQRICAVIHRQYYVSQPDAKNVVVVGGSFAGVALSTRLCETLPSGYRVVLVEKNSHFNYSFVFPRFSVLGGYEAQAFIPYDFAAQGAPRGIFRLTKGSTVDIKAGYVVLQSGERIEYSYLAIAAGSNQPLPAKVQSTEKAEACAELRAAQESIKSAASIAILGGGAVGVQLAADVKSFFPEKEVTIFHSGDRLLPQFGPRLHEHVMKAMNDLGVAVILNQRPEIIENEMHKPTVLRLQNHEVATFDLVISCTGQRPNSSLIRSMASNSISDKSGRILINTALQVIDGDGSFNNIFALGDVAETGGPRMARAAQIQAEVVTQNILALIRDRTPRKRYKPEWDLEGHINLTLGKNSSVMYVMGNDGRDALMAKHGGKEDLGVQHGWRILGANPDNMDKKR